MPPVESVISLDVILKTLEDNLNKGIDDYIANIQIRAKDLIARGVDAEVIQNILLEDVRNNANEFKQLTGLIGSNLDKVIAQTAMDTSNEAIAGLSDLYVWKIEPTAEHCDTCTEYNGQRKTYQEWQAIGLPGFGLTDCSIYCRCTLHPVI